MSVWIWFQDHPSGPVFFCVSAKCLWASKKLVKPPGSFCWDGSGCKLPKKHDPETEVYNTFLQRGYKCIASHVWIIYIYMYVRIWMCKCKKYIYILYLYMHEQIFPANYQKGSTRWTSRQSKHGQVVIRSLVSCWNSSFLAMDFDNVAGFRGSLLRHTLAKKL